MIPTQTQTQWPLVARWFAGLGALLLVACLGLSPAWAHNLQTKYVYMFPDPNTQQLLDSRAGSTDLIQVGDEIALIAKLIPRDGTTTGVGGHVDFYIPNGVQVVDVAYLLPGDSVADGITGYDRISMKGQSLIATGAGPVGARTTAELGTLAGPYTNINGVTADPVVAGTGLHRGTIAGVYGDTGIFYSTDPDTAYGSWQRFTGDPDKICGLVGTTGLTGKTITNNSGDVFVPCNKWDAGQMFAWGVKGTTCTAPGCKATPIVDYGDGRGNTPWGFGSGVAGPESGYAWAFDWNEYITQGASGASAMQAAMAPGKIGPWKRIKYAGSRVSLDQPGSTSVALGIASKDASNLGVAANTLPDTVSQSDATSPKAVRFSVGQLTALVPEYAWIKLRVKDVAALRASDGCPVFNGDTFGGDAGGTDNGKDHLWRYYEPSRFTWNACVAIGKPTDLAAVSVGQTFQYKVKMYNMGATAQTNVVIRDTLPAGVSFVSAFPAQNSGPNPLVWNLGTLPANGRFETLVTVKATGTGALDNTLCVTSTQFPTPQCTTETVSSGSYPILKQNKTVTPTSAAPGGTVTYTIQIDNIGSGPSASPTRIEERLDPALTYSSLVGATLNGASVIPTVTGAGTSNPVFNFAGGINAGGSLILTFNALVSASASPGEYCNYFTSYAGSTPNTTGSLACIQLAGGKIGDTIFRDWNGNGAQDAGEEGISGITVKLYESNGVTLKATTITDASGNYYFPGLGAVAYVVKVNDGTTPAGYVQTGDPDATLDNAHTVTLTENQQYLTADFGYKPTGAASIGDTVFEDIGNDGVYNGADAGIPGVTVILYEDTNGNGIIDAGVDAQVATTTTIGSGVYTFSNLAAGYDYLAYVAPTGNAAVQSYFDAKYGASTPYQISTPNPRAVDNLTGAYTVADFGFWKAAPASIGDQVFIDANGNGVYDAGDTPLASVTVTLYRDGQPFKTTVSGPDGAYLFDNLGPATYTVVVNTASAGVPAGYSAAVTQYNVTLTAGQSDLTADFPFAPLISKTVDKISAQAGNTLNFGVNVSYPGSDLLSNVTVLDPLPAGTSCGTVQAGGTCANYVSKVGVPGVDTGGSEELLLNPSADTYIRQDQATDNFNNNRVAVQPDVSGGNQRVGLINFDLTGIPSGSVINSASLTLVLQNNANGWTSANLYRLLTLWTAGGATWNDADGAGSGDWATSGVFGSSDYTTAGAGSIAMNVTADTPTTGDVTNLLKAWVESGSTNNGFALIGNTQSNDRAEIYSTEDNNGANTIPLLTVDYQPAGSPATTNTLTASPTTRAIDQPITVTVVLETSQTLNNVTPGSLTVYGGSATCTGPNEPVPADVIAGTPKTFTYTCIPSTQGELTFSGTPTSAGGYAFTTGTSNGVLVSQDGSTQVVTWNLGSNAAGTGGQTTVSSYIYGFQGGDLLTFWAYSPANSNWTTFDPTDAPTGVTVNAGGALTNDGSRYIYALRGDTTKVFLRYDAQNNTWDDAGIADLPATAANVVAGGALVYLNGYVYAFVGGDSQQFWRYDVSGNSWTQMASTPTGGTVKEGGSLATDGTNVYALRGDNTKVFWRYNVASNSWTALAPILTNNVKNGGALVYANGAFYALSGNNKQTFFRYNIAGNSWTPLANTGTNVQQGGALAYDGTYLYAFMGNGVGFKRYDIGADTWTAMTNAPGTVTWGGALTFLASGNSTRTSITAVPTLVKGGTAVKVTLTLTANNAINNIAAGAISVTGVTGANASCGGATLKSADNNLNGTSADSVVYEWTCATTAGANPGNVKFTANATAGGFTFASATSNTVLVTPTLTYAATVNTSPPAVIRNTALLQNVSPTSVPSNTTETATSSSIGDRVWNDLNGNGAQDSGELGLSGVRVYIDSNNNGVWDTGEPSALTDANGNYRFFGLTAGTYTVRVDPATYPAGYQPTTTQGLSETLASGTSQIDTADFGARPSATGPTAGAIGDTIWLDANENGVVDGTEAGISGVTVRLYRDANNSSTLDAGDYVIATRVTNASGNYSFGGLYTGNYLVDVDQTTLPAGLELVSPTGRADPQAVALDTAIDPTRDEIDFGYNWAGSIGDTLFYDTNQDGAQQSGETGVPDATVVLYADVNGNGVIDSSDTVYGVAFTDANGHYLFDNLPPGKYVVKADEQTVVAPPGSPNAGSTNIMQGTTGTKRPLDLAPGQDYLDADIGFAEVAKIEGHVFHDVNSNGVLEAGETRLSGVTVTLTGTDSKGNSITQTATTNASGEYRFLVPQGNYAITYNAGTGGAAGYPSATTPTTLGLSVIAGAEYANQDFGRNYASGIGDRVWNDANNNGIQDTGESGIAGVTVELYASNGTTLLRSTATDANGNYSFPGLADGSYVVKAIPPTGFTPSGEGEPGASCQGPPNTCDNSIPAIVSGGVANNTADFGYSTTGYSVSGTVWDDNGASGGTAEDGVRNGTEPGIANVTVTLYRDTNNNGKADSGEPVFATTTTDASGGYTFNGVPDGHYAVVVNKATLPSTAYGQTGDPDETSPPKCTTCDSQGNVDVSGGAVTGKNFGYRATSASISGAVCDGTGNGLCDSGDAALSGVTVFLTYAGRDGILGTADDVVSAATTVGGAYNFAGLAPGLYQITKVNPADRTSLADADGGNPNNISVNLAAAGAVTARDFEVKPAAGVIGDSVWLDVDRDGVRDIGEPGLANVSVALWSSSDGSIGNPDDRLVATAVTDLNGNYLFTSVDAGQYYVKVDETTLPASSLSVTAGTTNPTTPVINLTAGQSYLKADFGYVGATGTAIIGSLVWSDANNDGIQDPGEPGIGGVTVTLKTTGGSTVATVTTASDGSYYFTGVAPGTYVVDVTAPAGYTLTIGPQSSTDPTAPITVGAGQTYDEADFGYRNDALHGIADRVWYDADRDGVQDPGEAGIAGVTVNLYADTDGDGRFTKAIIDGKVDLNGDGAIDASDSGSWNGLSVTSGVLSQTSGILNGVPVVGGRLDTNGDGAIDSADDGQIVDEPIIATAITDDIGDFAFTGLPDGAYVMEIADNTGQLTDYQGTTPDAQAYRRAVAIAGANVGGAHFGYAGLGPIGNTVFGDTNGNGIQDPGESGIAGVTVKLYRDLNGNNAFDPGVDTEVATTTTDGSGHYAFNDLVSGVYFVSIDDSQSSLVGYTPTTTDQEATSATTTEIDANVTAGVEKMPVIVGGLDVNGDGVINGSDDGFAHGVKVIDGKLDLDDDGSITTADAGWWNGIQVLAGQLDVNADGAVNTGPKGADNGAVQVGQPSFPNADFGYRNTGLADVSGSVWNDLNKNAVDDGDGEPPIPGVTVALVDGAGKVVATTTTAADGSYTFPGVKAGSYKVVVTDQAGVLDGYTLTSGLDQIPVTVGAADVANINFGYVRGAGTGSIGDSVWLDANGDGVQSPAETGVSGVTVYLCSSSPCASGNAIATTTTDTNGNYLFSGLYAGNYYLGVEPTTVTSGLTQTTYPSGVNPSAVINLSEGEARQDADFGYKPAAGNAVLGNTVWYDVNGNGVQDAGEVGIGGVKITVLDKATGTVVATVTTNLDGSWLAVIPEDGTPSEYVVFVDKTTLPGGVVTTPTNMGGGDTYIAAVMAGDVRANLDFGYKGGNPASIGDAVWLDTNGDGARDAGEAGLSGVGLQIYTTGADEVAGTADDKFVAATTTDANGQYTFSGLLAGEYYVKIAGVPAGLAATADSGNTGAGLNATNKKTGEITLTAGQSYVAADFGYQPSSGKAAIGNRVWSDADGDGVQDPGEAGIGGATVYLCSQSASPCDSSTAIKTAVTAADGSYLFANVAAGNYTVAVDPGSVTGTVTGDPDAAKDGRHSLTVAAGSIINTVDFGYQNTGNASGSIGDTIYRSDQGNAGIPDVTVSLYAAGADNQIGTADDRLVASATTNASGIYGFTGLPADLYRVVVTDVNAKLAGLTLTNAPAASVTIDCSSGSCTAVTTQDFGYGSATTGSGSIGDTVYFDKNGNGSQDAGEPGIPGVTVELLDNTGKVLATKVTDANGAYSFTGLAAGGYSVRVATSPSDQGSVLFGLTPRQTAAGPISITCSGGSTCDTVNGADFGFAPTTGGTGTLGGTLWRDTNANGTLQAGESGIQGVTVELWLDVNGDGSIQPGTDNLVRTATTNVNGDYQFLGLPAGNYLVKVTDANGVTAGMTAVTGPIPVQDGNGHVNPYAVTLPAGATDTSVDFAYQATTAYSVSGTVFEDNGANSGAGLGTFNPTDPNKDIVAPNATVMLYRVINGVEYLFATTKTNSSGFYEFTNLPPTGPDEQYRVKVNTAGTILAGMQQTTDPDQTGRCTTSCDSQTTFTLSADKTGVSFGYWNGGVITTPVTLSYFRAAGENGRIVFEWATATETGNIGFTLYIWLNGDLVEVASVESKVVDAVEETTYRYEAYGVYGDQFALMDIDRFGRETLHGPFKLNKAYGSLTVDKSAPAAATRQSVTGNRADGLQQRERQKTDWEAIRNEHEAEQLEQQKARKAEQLQRLERMLDNREKMMRQQLRQSPPPAKPDKTSQAAPGWGQQLAGLLAGLLMGVAHAADQPANYEALVTLAVRDHGLYRVTYEQLKAAGADLAGVGVNRLALRQSGQPVALLAKGQTNGDEAFFGPGGYLEFIAKPRAGLYGPDVFTLSVDSGVNVLVDNASLPEPEPVTPTFYMQTVTEAPQKVYSNNSPTDDPWYWARLLAFKKPTQGSFSITVDNYVANAAPATLTVGMWGGTDWPGTNDHHVKLTFNGQAVGDHWFDGITAYPVIVALSAGALKEGTNTLTINLPLDTGTDRITDLVGLDSISVTYPRRFQLRNGRLIFTAAANAFEVKGLAQKNARIYRQYPDGRVEQLTKLAFAGDCATSGQPTCTVGFVGAPSVAATYYVFAEGAQHTAQVRLAPALEDITHGAAEYLIITHPNFIGPELDALVQLRESTYKVKMVDVEQIFAQFSHYRVDPKAIQQYIAYAHANLGTRMVLLVGGDSYDYHNYLGKNVISFIPTLYAKTDALVNYAPVDPLFTDLDGDLLPDLPIGRLPVRTKQELAVQVRKIEDYDARTGDDETAVFAADDYDQGQSYSFKADSEAMIARLPAGWQAKVARVYQDDLGVGGARSALLAALNQGVALTSFVGHSSATMWTFDNLFTNADPKTLTNAGKPTVVIQWGCWNTWFVSVTEDSMAHQFLLNGDRGAVAVLGAATLTEASHERELAFRLYDRLLVKGPTMGEAVLEAKQAYAEDLRRLSKNPRDYLDVLLGWNLLGDPATIIQP
jgi:uncharacterized repeat protein (TIGR01451 family)